MYSDIISANYHMAHNISHIRTENYLIHSHSFYEIYYFLAGDVRFIYAGTAYELQPHTIVLIAPNVFHGIHVRSEEPHDRYTAHFTEDLLPLEHRAMLMGSLPTEESLRGKREALPYIIRDSEQLQMLSFMEEFQRLAQIPQPLRDVMVSTLTQMMIVRLLLYAPRSIPIETLQEHYTSHQELDPILNYIHHNLTRKLSLDELSNRFFISKSKLNMLFRKCTNCTVMEYVTRQRLNYAQQLLINGLPASQAGTEAGFGDYTSFYRAYKKIMGRTPVTDLRESAKSQRSPLVVDSIDQLSVSSNKFPMEPEDKQRTIWDMNPFMSATEVDISTLRDAHPSHTQSSK